MFTLGVPEMAVIFILALVLFGPKKLPELGRTIGKAMTEFRRASNDLKATFDREMQTLERENQSLQQSSRETAREIYDYSQVAQTTFNPLELPPGEQETATQPSTVGASEVQSAESNEPANELAPTAPSGPQGTVPRSGTQDS